MIKTETLFILGAGASQPFGYPTSTELRDKICSKEKMPLLLELIDDEKGDSVDHQIFRERLEKFYYEFLHSCVSIDSFLEQHEEFMDVGKMAIAAELIEHEHDDRLRRSPNNWYMYLHGRLIEQPFQGIAQNKISFITFNYDRSLEKFFFEAIKSTLKITSDECAKQMQQIPIVHLYGQLDPLPPQGGREYPYSPDRDKKERIANARSNIKLISHEEDVSKSEEFIRANKLIKQAEKIYFLGFGFDQVNLGRLDVPSMKDKNIYGTAHRLEPAKQKWVTEYFQRVASAIKLIDEDVLNLLKRHLEIE